MQWLIENTKGYSSADLTAVCKEAAMEPVREISPEKILTSKASNIRKVRLSDFEKALRVVRPSVSKQSILEYGLWHKACAGI